MSIITPRASHFVEPVREFTGDHRRLTVKLLPLLEQQRAILAEALVKGGPKDFAEYRNRVGVIEGLDIAIERCKQVQSQL